MSQANGRRSTAMVEDEEIEPIVLTSPKDVKVERITLFSLDGVDYDVPKKVRFNVSLKLMRIASTEGEVAAIDYMMTELLGENGWEALREFEGLTEEEFNSVVDIGAKIALGPTEAANFQARRALTKELAKRHG